MTRAIAHDGVAVAFERDDFIGRLESSRMWLIWGTSDDRFCGAASRRRDVVAPRAFPGPAALPGPSEYRTSPGRGPRRPGRVAGMPSLRGLLPPPARSGRHRLDHTEGRRRWGRSGSGGSRAVVESPELVLGPLDAAGQEQHVAGPAACRTTARRPAAGRARRPAASPPRASHVRMFRRMQPGLLVVPVVDDVPQEVGVGLDGDRPEEVAAARPRNGPPARRPRVRPSPARRRAAGRTGRPSSPGYRPRTPTRFVPLPPPTSARTPTPERS